MKAPQYDFTLLMQKLYSVYPDIHDFAHAAGVDPVQFLTAIAESDLTAETIDKCVTLLDIHPEEIDKYFFTPQKEYVAKRGRPVKEVPMTTTPPKHTNYYTIAEAVSLLGISKHTLQARLRDKTLKGKLIGREWRIYRDELFDNSSYYYYFDCMDENFGEKYLTPYEIDAIENHHKHPDPLFEGEIVAIARNLEAVLYRCKEKDGTQEVCVYDCMDI